MIVALPSVGFAEEMQTKVTFGNGAGSTPSNGTFHHEVMHQWFGDHVSESAFRLTFWKEGWATVGEYLLTASNAANFDTSLINRFNTNYAAGGNAWTGAPSNPTVASLFTTSSTYTRPATAYLALRQIPADPVEQTFTIHGPIVTDDAPDAGATVQYSDSLAPDVTVSRRATPEAPAPR